MSIEAELRHTTSCECRFDEISRLIYSVDASIYEVKPLGIILPRSEEDLKRAVDILSRNQIPIIPRGAATGITGGCLGEGVIIDTSKYLKQIDQVDLNRRCIRCQPGVVQDDLNAYLAPYGYRLGPDTSTGNRATIGGMVANHAAGARSLHYGTMVDAVEALSLILATGETLHLGSLSEVEWNEKLSLKTVEGTIYRAAEKIRKNYKIAIETQYPPLPRRASGYTLDQLIKPFPLNMAKLIVGSEGTLGAIANVTLSIAALPSHLELCLLGFDSILSAMDAVPTLLAESPVSLELMDDKILTAGTHAPSLRGKIEWLQKIPGALLVAEFQNTKAQQIAERFSHYPGVKFTRAMRDTHEMHNFWELRKAGLGLLLSKRSYSRAIAFIEDISIPPKHLTSFMRWFLDYMKSLNKEAGIYGHVGSGCLHIRPYIDLRSPQEIQLIKKAMQEITDQLVKVGGALSGEHGDGLIRSWLNEALFGREIVEAFHLLKKAFDPLALMNPHKVVDPVPVDRFLRKSPSSQIKTFLSFEKEGGLELTVDLCNGNGICRKKEGVMCPSYQVTEDEYDTTRARAVTLRNALRHNTLEQEDLHEILALCIQCKGCKTECPSQVDMAKLKSETLYHYHNKWGASLRDTLFAHIDTVNKWLFPLRKLQRIIASSSLGKALLSLGGFTGPLPQFAKERFSNLIKSVLQPTGKPVILINDTYMEFYCPEIGLAAVHVLNRLGYQVIVPPWNCCGRPAISKGFLKHAKKNAENLWVILNEYTQDNIPLVGLEPSCLFTLWDEFHALLPEKKTLSCQLFDSFVLQQVPLKIRIPQSVALHGHCHHKALQGMQDTLELLRSFKNVKVTEIPSGCCGMAGSFGHEKEHAEFSRRIGELTLLPFIRKLPKDTCIIANGFSCRSQIVEHTGRKALHLAEWLASTI